jgi:hypothetical protein
MGDLLARALNGVDPDSPDAFWQIFRNLMALMPWWPMFWFTVACVAIGVAIAWYRGGSIPRAVVWALVLGPIGWLISWHAVPPPRACPRCATRVPARAARCPHCGCRMTASAPAKT